MRDASFRQIHADACVSKLLGIRSRRGQKALHCGGPVTKARLACVVWYVERKGERGGGGEVGTAEAMKAAALSMYDKDDVVEWGCSYVLTVV